MSSNNGNRRSDDGSQAWFDQQVRSRQQRHQTQGNSKSYLDQKVNQPQIDQAAKEAQITDPYIRDLVARRAQQPHFNPVPIEKEVRNVDMDAILQQQMQLHQVSGIPSNAINDADIDRLFHRNQGQQQQPQQYNPAQQASQQVSLREGYPVYRASQQAYGNTVILAREVGVVDGRLATQPFVVAKYDAKAYVVPQQQMQVNIQEILNNPRLLTPLVEVHAPPMLSLGPLLVHREAVVAAGSYNGRQVITDGRQHGYNNHQPQQYYPQDNQRRILKG